MLHVHLNTWQTPEKMTIETIPEIEKASQKARKKLSNTNWTIDCFNTTLFDSSGMAWLLYNIKFAQENIIQLEICNFNLNSAKVLADSHGVFEVLKPYLKKK
jgi:anti-anti-sigma regulatory factor